MKSIRWNYFIITKKTILKITMILFSMTIVSCASLFYYPRATNVKFYDPQQVGLKQEEIEFTDEEGTRLHGWWFSARTKESLGTVIFFHGNAENITTHFLTLSWLPEKGYNYFIFDYPNYGVSQGKPTPRTTVLAGKAAIKWVNKNKDQRPLIVYAQSLGGIVGLRSTLDVKDQVPIRNLILDATFLSYRSIARQKASENILTWLLQPIAWLVMSDSYAPKDIDKLAPVPLLVIHGQKDIVVHPKFGEEIFNKASEPKQIWRIPEGQHGDTFWKHEKIYRQKLLDYLRG
jgi:fermentation-respiration switch protein FrsA (DUF1100 family)